MLKLIIKSEILLIAIMTSQSLTVDNRHDFDIVIIGGGAAGLACANEAVKSNLRVAVVNYDDRSSSVIGDKCKTGSCAEFNIFHSAAQYIQSRYVQQALGVNTCENSDDRSLRAINWDQLKMSLSKFTDRQSGQSIRSLDEQGISIFNSLGQFNADGGLDLLDQDNNLHRAINSR